MVKKAFVLLLFLYSLRLAAQPVYDPASSPYLETVLFTPSFTDAFTCAANPATLPGLNGFAAGMYCEKKYLIEGLNLAAFSMAYGRKSGGIGISAKYFGNIAYHELHASLNYAKNLGNLAIGASFNYNGYAISGFNRLTIFSFGVHSLLKLSDKVYTSLQLMNPPFSRFSSSGARQIAEYHLGFSYESSPVLCFSFDFQKAENMPLQIRSALQYRPGQKFHAKIGVFTSGPQPFIGIGWMMKDFQAQLSICYHPALGTTPGVLFAYQKILSPDMP